MYTTKVSIAPSPVTIDHRDSGLILGSCFAQEVGARMLAAKFRLVDNPSGIIFNPVSISRAYDDLVTQRRYVESDLVQHGTLWHSMHHHGSFSSPNSLEVLHKINRDSLPMLYDYVIVTLGSAWVYEYRGEVVANCHKIPSREFVRRRLTVDECVAALEPIAHSGAKVVVTVSPVRHIKDGLAENSLSKSILRVASAELAEVYENVHYFPSFEIVMDELRDYRYYSDDMLHPSAVAVEYIWQRFGETFFTADTRDLVRKIEKINAALAHRPINPSTDEYRKFCDSTQEKISALTAEYPEIKF